MKLKVKWGRESRLITFENREPADVTLSELRREVSAQFGLDQHDFQLSLNKRDFFTGEDQSLSEFGLVSGDLLHLTGTDLPDPQAPQARPQPLGTYSATTSNVDNAAAGLSSSDVVSSSANSDVNLSAPQSQSDMAGQNQIADSGYLDDEVEKGPVNRYLQEPLMIRESSGRQVPVLLSQLYTSAVCSCPTDALWVAVHALMVEAGFIPCECPDQTLMPASWKRNGFYLCNYTYNVTPDSATSCSLTGVTLGASVAVHAIPRTETGFKTESLQLNSSHYVCGLNEDVPSVYRALDKLSRLIKDTICLPVINEIVTAAGFRERQGLLAMPWEVTLRILTYLDARSLCHVGQTCQEMKVACNDRLIWRRLYIRDFGRLSNSSLDRPWYQLYKEKQEDVRRQEERRRQPPMLIPDPLFPPHAGPFHPFPFPPRTMPGIIGGEYDLRPEFTAGGPNPFGRGRGNNPLRLPGPRPNPRDLDPFGGNPFQLPGSGRRGGNMTGSPFSGGFRGHFF